MSMKTKDKVKKSCDREPAHGSLLLDSWTSRLFDRMILYSLFTPASVKSPRECWAYAYAPTRFGDGSVTKR